MARAAVRARAEGGIMAELGMNVRQNGKDDPELLHELGIRWIRIKPTNHVDLTGYVKKCQGLVPRINVLLVIDGQSLTKFNQDGSEVGPMEPAEAAALYAARYHTADCRADAW